MLHADEHESCMKRGGRKHDRKTKEAIRMMAVERVREGESVAAFMDS